MPSPTRVHVREVEHEHEHHVITVLSGNIPIVMQYNELLLILHSIAFARYLRTLSTCLRPYHK